MDPSQSSGTTAISEDEIALYDRQIRLWGLQAQQKIRKASILLLTLRALGNEIAKNLVLAGISSLTILDPAPATPVDLGAQFFLSTAQSESEESVIGKNRAQASAPSIQKLNPRVAVKVDEAHLSTKDDAFFAQFDVVIATDLPTVDLTRVNNAVRRAGKAFYAAGTCGMYGFIFADLGEHEYVIQRDAGNVTTKLGDETRTRSVVDVRTKKEGVRSVESVTKREIYSPFADAALSAKLPEEYAKSKRRLRGVTPVLPCLRALWSFVSPDGTSNVPRKDNRDDLGAYTQLAMAKHSELGLPPETLTPAVIRQFLQGVGCEIAPVSAVLGGQLAQDVINVLGRTQQPIQNTVVFDGDRMEAQMYALHPERSLGKSANGEAKTNGEQEA
ncbi:hypothetical protein jhhlp_001225 [Lomentospora prolificans]|uniref:Ubiquitin-like 1-activating enzyme E1A n=1 Tax=Lomentospora prolificans TaxID=41688 RepID=A0A2N3NHL9_9PEZI|nr:hypothetical protein jhhlp_001225 [Lomentospora prolificans]